MLSSLWNNSELFTRPVDRSLNAANAFPHLSPVHTPYYYH